MSQLHVMLILACLLVLLSIGASKASERLGVPSLLVFLATGIINRAELEWDGLYPVLTLALVLLTYALTHYAGATASSPPSSCSSLVP